MRASHFDSVAQRGPGNKKVNLLWTYAKIDQKKGEASPAHHLALLRDSCINTPLNLSEKGVGGSRNSSCPVFEGVNPLQCHFLAGAQQGMRNRMTPINNPLVLSFQGIPGFIPSFPTYRTSKLFKGLGIISTRYLVDVGRGRCART